MVAVTSRPAPPTPVDTPHPVAAVPTPARHIGVVPTASMITGGAVAVVWRVPQTSDRKGAAAVVTARTDTGDITIDELRR